MSQVQAHLVDLIELRYAVGDSLLYDLMLCVHKNDEVMGRILTVHMFVCMHVACTRHSASRLWVKDYYTLLLCNVPNNEYPKAAN